MSLPKQELHTHCITVITEKLLTVNNDLKQLKKSSESDSKSAMGDKYETSTELINQERNKLESVKTELLSQIDLLKKVKKNKSSHEIGFGSLVKTENGYFYFSIPLGMFNFKNERVACISLKSPIALNMIGKQAGDVYQFNAKSIKIIEVY